ncbi:MAG: hypothetical protein AAF141_12245 [Pseudomonadota bacterium]
MIDVALAILAGEKGVENGKQSLEARRFAVRILRQYSEIEEDRENESVINWDLWAEDSQSNLQIDRDLISGRKQSENERIAISRALAFLRRDLEEEITAVGVGQDGTRRAAGCGPVCRDLQRQISELEARLED